MSEKISFVANIEEYYFEELENSFKSFEDYKINDKEIDTLIDRVSNFYKNNTSKNNKFLEFIEKNVEYKELLELMGKIISICDLNASNKEYFNPYQDKRTVAKAGVRQNDWIINLLKYKKSGLEEISPSIKATLEYIKNPMNNLTVLSENHKKLISEKLLNSEYSKDTFILKLKEYFDKELNKYQIINKKNINIIISNLVYMNEIKSIWLSEKKIEDSFKEWLISIKKLSPKTFINYTNRLKNGIPEKLINVQFKNKKESLYILTINDLVEINELFEKNNYDLQTWNSSKTIGTEAWNSLKYLIEFFNNKELEITTINSDNKAKREIMILNKTPKNQILYGSPGTGKTYNTINKALEIIFNIDTKNESKKVIEDELVKLSKKELTEEEKKDIENDSRKILKACFEKYKNNGQIEFVTFHQSYGYEEFVEGIKASSLDDESNTAGSLSYKVEDGIFKKLCEKAENKEYLIDSLSINDDSSIWKISLGSTYSHEIKTKCFNDNEIRIGWTDVQKIDDDNFKKLGSNNQSTITNFIENMKIGDLVISIYNQNKIDGIGIIESNCELDNDEHYNKYRKVKWLSKDILDLTQLNGNKVFVQKTVYKINRFKPKDLLSLVKQNEFQIENDNTNKNYILIIDEINRGNISKIFGELITLIEPSKRIGADEEIRLKLPYSNKNFGVPQNLYIIGTMNTADRSIALMDTALRRRFHFEEMMPNPKLLKDLNVGEIDIKLLLETINKRIEYLYDRDHTIGHAYFMSLENLEDKKAELDNIFRNKIIPLLQEYFYDDWEKIQIILGDHPEQFKKKSNLKEYLEYQFIQSKVITEEEILGFDHPDIENEAIEYKVNNIFIEKMYIKIYSNYPQIDQI